MFAQGGHLGSGQPQDLRAEVAEFTVAENQDLIASVDLDLPDYFKGGGQRFSENRLLITDRGWALDEDSLRAQPHTRRTRRQR